MEQTKPFFLSVTQRVFSNWTALKVSFYINSSFLLILNKKDVDKIKYEEIIW
jgi:hypothetical protein